MTIRFKLISRRNHRNQVSNSSNNALTKAGQLVKDGKFQKASKLLFSALKKEPNNIELLKHLSYSVANTYFPSILDEYMSFLEGMSPALPISLHVKKSLGIAYFRKGAIEETYGRYWQASNFLGKAEKTFLKVLELVKEDKDLTYETLCNLGFVKSLESEFDDAMSYFEKAREIEPSGIDALAGYIEAVSHANRNKPDELESLLTFVDSEIRKHPASPDVYIAKATVLEQLRRLPQAIAALKEAAKIDPERAGIYLNLTKVYGSLGKKIRAHYYAYKAVRKDKGSNLLSYIYYQVMGGIK